MRFGLMILPLALVACDAPLPATDGAALPLMGGYRAEADQCRRVGENAYTNQFLDDAADLVACPVDMENIGVFVTETNAERLEVSPDGGWVLYTVPNR